MFNRLAKKNKMINSRNYNFSILFWLNKDRIQSNGEMRNIRNVK